MWLLSTDRAELHFFPSVQAAQIARFAILSHVWNETEQTFQETQDLRVNCQRKCRGYPFSRTRVNPRDLSSVKVRESCKLAERHGYKWIWNDTCCIDKTSSSELSESINSMFSYYSHADVCYGYLGDVTRDTDCPLDAKFRQSRWFTRGWTLQELLAPDRVIFLSSAWTFMGTKATHARLVSEITKIPEVVLLLEEEIWDMSVARRMSWASQRKTTRAEDDAYCLMGIFDINMPPLYGEGKKAFGRLQEEIMKRSTDSTLFAWSHLTFLPSDADEMSLLSPSTLLFSRAGDLLFAPDTMYKIYNCVSQQDEVRY
ncbi:HET-domain-containing protein [Polyporus arcularius HHB13444]|uniref:HET-domain-containing protein n=1 Tax=Polyporus arcularius HHB13444 TaxID=1314778 RepID=A0A5C3PFT2_9APHY|nr:HET-domain-containing protein [Polyporus arcularius HHB13444]